MAALSEKLQNQHRETLTAAEIEAAGREVGLDPVFIRQALDRLTERDVSRPDVASPVPPADDILKNPGLAAAWWAAGWTLPLFLLLVGTQLLGGAIGAALLFLGFFIYIGGGTFLHHNARSVAPARAVVAEGAPLSRAQLLDVLFRLQRQLEGQQQHRAFLSVDVVNSSQMKRSAPALAVEYSFGQFRHWVEEHVRECGGEMQSAAGDGVMCLLPDERSAVRAARRLQDGVILFNAGRNHMPQPFQIRCGISAGAVALEAGVPLGHLQSAVIDRAAELQKRGRPGSIVVGYEVAGAALLELRDLQPLEGPEDEPPAFAWQAKPPPALPPDIG